MAGREVFGKEELREVQDVLERKVLFRYGFDADRKGIFKVSEFEKEFARYMGSRYALGVSSGSAALKVALESLNLPRGKEILVPCFTFVASVEAIEEAGCRPVLCEIDETFNLDPADVERRITSDTVAILPVHMMGAAAAMERLAEIARRRELRLVEDNCQGTGGSLKGKKLGTFGDMGCFSFDYVKVMTTGEGGMVVTDSEELYRQSDWYHDHGHPHLPGVPRGKEARKRGGFNYRMNEIQGALGLAQLRKLDSILAAQRENKKTIKKEIQNIGGISFRTLLDPEGDIATFLVLLLPDADRAERFRQKMTELGVVPGTMNYWHFVANIEACGGTFPRSKEILDRAVFLEILVNMPGQLLARIVDAIKRSASAVL